MPYIVDIQMSYPKNYYNQDELTSNLIGLWKNKIRNIKRVESIQKNVLVKGRHLAVPLEKYFSFKSFDERNNAFIEESVELAVIGIKKILKKNNINEKDITSLWSNTVTGFAIPSIESRVMNRLPFEDSTKRVPLFGLGCMAGVAGLNRVADYLKGNPDEAVLFFSVELCSLTLQLEDISVANLISTGLFGDGCGVVLMVGDNHPLSKKAPLKWIGSRSKFFKNTEDVMGWNVGEKGLKIILKKSVPDVTENLLPEPMHVFLKDKGLSLKDISTFVAHPGGPKVLYAIEKVLGLPAGGLGYSWESLSANGNMSSVSVLDIFKRTLDAKSSKSGFLLSLAMGPGFSAELGLYQWN